MPNYNSTLQSNNTDLQAILNTINELPQAGGEQATPVISVNNSNGLITATAGTKTSTHQLAFQTAKTITPTIASQIAVSSGYYTGGSVTVAAVPTQTKTVTPTSTTQNITPDSGKFLSKVTVNGDSDLLAGNIKKGVDIFGVVGTYEGSGGGNTSAEDAIINKTITSYTNDRVTSIGDSAFTNCYSLTSISFPVATSIGNFAFAYCSSLTSISFPVATRIGHNAFYCCRSLTSVSFPVATFIGEYAFDRCSSLTSISFPVATSICSNAFYSCTRLTSISFPVATSIGNYAFSSCTRLTSIRLGVSSICSLANSNAFSRTSIWSNKGSIFVPASLVNSYKAATNWTFFSNRIYGM